MKKQLIALYIEWFNNFLTISRISEYYGIDSEDMKVLIEMGKKYHEEEIELNKPTPENSDKQPIVDGLPDKLTLLVTGTGKRDNKITDTDLLLRTCDHAIYLAENSPHNLAHTLVDRYNEFNNMYEALIRARDWFYLNIKKTGKQPACIPEIEAILTRINSFTRNEFEYTEANGCGALAE